MIIGHNGQRAGRRVQTVHLVRQTRFRPKVLPVAILGIGEVYFTVARVHRDIVQGVELPAKIVVDKHCYQVSSNLVLDS